MRHSGCRRVIQSMLVVMLVLAALAVGFPLVLRWWTDFCYRRLIYAVDDVPERRVAIVFGAGIWPDGRLSDVLADRVDTAVALYEQGQVEKLLFTGDNSTIYYNEPQHMYDHVVARGVPAEDIVLDYAGRRTYDSCYRAHYIFGVDGAILVTQAYHMDRALFIAHNLGIDAVGVAADRQSYYYIRHYWFRELLATALAWWEVKVSHPVPIMGDPLPIFAD